MELMDVVDLTAQVEEQATQVSTSAKKLQQLCIEYKMAKDRNKTHHTNAMERLNREKDDEIDQLKREIEQLVTKYDDVKEQLENAQKTPALPSDSKQLQWELKRVQYQLECTRNNAISASNKAFRTSGIPPFEFPKELMTPEELLEFKDNTAETP